MIGGNIPCGTPDLTFILSDLLLNKLLNCNLSLRYDWKQL